MRVRLDLALAELKEHGVDARLVALDHALHIIQQRALIVPPRVVCSLRGAQLLLVPCLVVIWLLTQHKRLDREQHL